MKTYFHNKDFALSLALKWRLGELGNGLLLSLNFLFLVKQINNLEFSGLNNGQGMLFIACLTTSTIKFNDARSTSSS